MFLQNSTVIHIATLNEGVSRCGQIEILIKSILLYHKGIIHIHAFADVRCDLYSIEGMKPVQFRSREMLSVMFQTWALERGS